MKRLGKKGKQWIKDRARLIKEAVLSDRIVLEGGVPYGKCEDCGEWKILDPDHRKKRSQGGLSTKENTDWVCRKCHNKRDNEGDPMNKKTKNIKPEWAKDHKCIHCKTMVATLICSNCNKLSVKGVK